MEEKNSCLDVEFIKAYLQSSIELETQKRIAEQTFNELLREENQWKQKMSYVAKKRYTKFSIWDMLFMACKGFGISLAILYVIITIIEFADFNSILFEDILYFIWFIILAMLVVVIPIYRKITDYIDIKENSILDKQRETSIRQQANNALCIIQDNKAIKNIDSSVDLLIVDIGLPDGDGINLYQELQKNGRIPAIFLTAKDDEKDMLKAFDIGADDYVVKPFSIKVLLKRMEVVLKRKSNENVFMCGQVILYSDRKQVFVGKTEISLTLKEYQLLEYFIMNQNQVLTKEMIMENIWGIDSEFIDPNTISVMISRLKKKLNDSSNVISNVFGMGYRMGD